MLLLRQLSRPASTPATWVLHTRRSTLVSNRRLLMTGRSVSNISSPVTILSELAASIVHRVRSSKTARSTMAIVTSCSTRVNHFLRDRVAYTETPSIRLAMIFISALAVLDVSIAVWNSHLTDGSQTTM